MPCRPASSQRGAPAGKLEAMRLVSRVLGLAVLLVAVPAAATVLHAWSLEERIARADNVVAGKVVGVETRRTDDGMIFTESTIAVTRTLYGPTRSSVVVSQLGGTIGEDTLSIAGTVLFTVGDEVMVIIKRDAAGREQLVGMSQGAFFVTGRTARQNIDVPLMRDGRLEAPPGVQTLDVDRIRSAASEVRRTLERTQP